MQDVTEKTDSKRSIMLVHVGYSIGADSVLSFTRNSATKQTNLYCIIFIIV